MTRFLPVLAALVVAVATTAWRRCGRRVQDLHRAARGYRSRRTGHGHVGRRDRDADLPGINSEGHLFSLKLGPTTGYGSRGAFCALFAICKGRRSRRAGGKVSGRAPPTPITAAAAALLAAPSALAPRPDPEIAGLQVALRSKGMYFGKIDGLAGPMTAKGLRTFQRLTCLPVTGELGPRTRAELGALGRPLVARRVLVRARTAGTSPRSSSCSRAPVISGCSTSTATSAPRRRRRLIRFQRSRGLAADGVAGPATLTRSGTAAARP